MTVPALGYMYSFFLIVYAIGWPFSAAFIVLSSKTPKNNIFSKYVKASRAIFLSCFSLSWLLGTFMFLAIPEFHWVVAILMPPLILSSAASLWALFKKFKQISITKLCVALNISLVTQISIFFFYLKIY